jgi:hypothetical protein
MIPCQSRSPPRPWPRPRPRRPQSAGHDPLPTSPYAPLATIHRPPRPRPRRSRSTMGLVLGPAGHDPLATIRCPLLRDRLLLVPPSLAWSAPPPRAFSLTLSRQPIPAPCSTGLFFIPEPQARPLPYFTPLRGRPAPRSSTAGSPLAPPPPGCFLPLRQHPAPRPVSCCSRTRTSCCCLRTSRDFFVRICQFF